MNFKLESAAHPDRLGPHPATQTNLTNHVVCYLVGASPLHPQYAQCSTHTVALPAQNFVWARRVSDSGATFVKIRLEGCEDVADVTKRAREEFSAAADLELFLVTKAGKAPTRTELDAALIGEPLRSFDLLADAGIVAGACLLARVPAAVIGASRLSATAQPSLTAATARHSLTTTSRAPLAPSTVSPGECDAERGVSVLSTTDFGRLAWEACTAAHNRLCVPIFRVGDAVRPHTPALEARLLPDCGSAKRDRPRTHDGEPLSTGSGNSANVFRSSLPGGDGVPFIEAVTPVNKKAN